MSIYQQSSLPDPSGRNRRPTRGGSGRLSPNDLFRRRLGAVLLLGILIAPVVWALRGDNTAVDVTHTGGAAAVIGFNAGTDAPLDSEPEGPIDPGDSLAVPASDTSLVVQAVATEPVTQPEVTEPPATTALSKKVCAVNYTVQAGDSWYRIASKVGVKASLIAGANNRTIRAPLMVGQVICLPAGAVIPSTTVATTVAPAKAQCNNTYKVVAGDSWYGIASKVGAKINDLTAVNSMTLRSILHIGDVICLPAGAKAPVPSTTTPKSSGSANVVSVRRYTRAELEAIVRDVWPDDLEETAFFVIGRESNWNNLSQNSCCLGIFQLNFNAHKSWMKNYGVTDRSQLLDPVVNAQLGLVVYNRSGGWGPWCTTNWCPTI